MKTLRVASYKLRVAALLLLTISLLACGTVGTSPGSTPAQQMTPKQVYTLAATTYNQEYDSTMATMQSSASTPAQISIAQKKKAILTQMWPALNLVGNTLDNGGTPKDIDLQSLNSFIDQLTAAATGGK